MVESSLQAESKPTRQREAVQHEQSFPLISVVQMVTYCVALMTCADFRRLSSSLGRISPQQPWQVIFPVLGALSVGLLIGVLVGLGQIGKWRGTLLCGGAGALVGLLILAVYVAPAPPAQAVAACLLPLVSTIILRARAA